MLFIFSMRAPSLDSSFSVSSLFSPLSQSSTPFKSKAPPIVLAFAWLVLRGKIFTILCRHNTVVVYDCLLCLSAKESVDHLLLNCKTAITLRTLLLRDVNCCWVLPRSYADLFDAWVCPTGSPRGEIMWQFSFLAYSWPIWRGRNHPVASTELLLSLKIRSTT